MENDEYFYSINKNDIDDDELLKLHKEFKECITKEDINPLDKIYLDFDSFKFFDKFDKLKEYGFSNLKVQNNNIPQKKSKLIIKKILLFFYSGVIDFNKNNCLTILEHAVWLKSKPLIKEIQHTLITDKTSVISEDFFFSIAGFASEKTFYFFKYENFIFQMIKTHKLFIKKSNKNYDSKVSSDLVATVLKGIENAYNGHEHDPTEIKKTFLLSYAITDEKTFKLLGLRDFFNEKLPIPNKIRLNYISDHVLPLILEMNEIRTENSNLKKLIDEINNNEFDIDKNYPKLNHINKNSEYCCLNSKNIELRCGHLFCSNCINQLFYKTTFSKISKISLSLFDGNFYFFLFKSFKCQKLINKFQLV